MRRKKLHFLGVTLVLTLLVSGTFLVNKHFNVMKSTGRTTESNFSPNPWRHVTKSLAELGKMDEVNKYFLFMNHVPKCGSEILILLLQKLQGVNNYRHVRLKGGNKRHLSSLQQEELVSEIYNVIKTEAIPLSFDRHVYFINFTSFDKQLPTFINLVRDPIDMIASRTPFKGKSGQHNYYYKCLLSKKHNCNFKIGYPYDFSIPYFCGHDTRCMLLNNEWAIRRAKSNVERYYPVVGILEELNATLEILENKVPYFFKGVQNTYQKELLHFHQGSTKPEVPPIIKKKLEETLVLEIEFYEWLKSRLFRQLQVLYGGHHSH